MWLTLGNIALMTAAVITTAVVIVYSFSRFETSQVGRQFWLTKLSLALILDFGAMNLLIVGPPSSSPSTPWRAVIYALVSVIMLRWFIIILKTQRETRRKKHPVWDAPDEPPNRS